MLDRECMAEGDKFRSFLNSLHVGNDGSMKYRTFRCDEFTVYNCITDLLGKSYAGFCACYASCYGLV
jgi:hypothetical protein